MSISAVSKTEIEDVQKTAHRNSEKLTDDSLFNKLLEVKVSKLGQALFEAQKNQSLEMGFDVTDPLALNRLKAPPYWQKVLLRREFRAVDRFPKVTEKMLIAESERLNQLSDKAFALIRIKNNTAYATFPKSKQVAPLEKEKTRQLVLYLNNLAKLGSLPDTCFLYLCFDGFLEGDDKLFNPQVPIFALTKPQGNKDVLLIPSPSEMRSIDTKGTIGRSYNWKRDYLLIDAYHQMIPFKERIPKLFWRGCITDTDHGKDKNSPRLNLLALAQENPHLMDAKALRKNQPESIVSTSIYATKAQQMRYLYQLAMDGVTSTYPGMHWRLLSGNVVFKQNSPNKQWFYSELQPYKHFIPVAHDLSDLATRVKWLQEHPEKAKLIAKQSRSFAQNKLSFESIAQYVRALLFAYAKRYH